MLLHSLLIYIILSFNTVQSELLTALVSTPYIYARAYACTHAWVHTHTYTRIYIFITFHGSIS
jgi:hypothetical protein